nr:hypothetical protein OG513_07635 [Streptomyces sp. NBC_00998]
MGVFDGEIYRVRSRFDDDPEMGIVTVYTDDPRGYFEGLEKHGIAPSAATVHHLNYVLSDTDLSFGNLEDE